MRVGEAAEYLGMSVAGIRKAASEGRLPPWWTGLDRMLDDAAKGRFTVVRRRYRSCRMNDPGSVATRQFSFTTWAYRAVDEATGEVVGFDEVDTRVRWLLHLVTAAGSQLLARLTATAADEVRTRPEAKIAVLDAHCTAIGVKRSRINRELAFHFAREVVTDHATAAGAQVPRQDRADTPQPRHRRVRHSQPPARARAGVNPNTHVPEGTLNRRTAQRGRAPNR